MRWGGRVGAGLAAVVLGGILSGSARADHAAHGSRSAAGSAPSGVGLSADRAARDGSRSAAGSARSGVRLSVEARPRGAVRPGGLVDYRIEVRNPGESRLPRARMTVRKPEGVSVIGLGRGCREDAGRVVCELGALPPHARRDVPIWGIVDADARGRQLLVARAGGASARSVVRVRPGTDLAVRVRPPREVVAGRDFVLRAQVVNRGPRTARGVWLAAGSEARRGERRIGTLMPGESAWRSFTLRVPADARRSAEVYATAGADRTGDVLPANNSAITTIRIIRR
ncbi:hypothetical protein [Actinocorallia populi]|uniref:hypothetical protein n=1 Tax=Actinocorallia populi TaxID=2079200 RepID=UPI000D087623|nr:hypothetical protein [Actinocorallia populi]